ncbi:myo-inositol-1(or 4)-monophosphatase [Thermoflavifilum aggregans]|uniref:Inositol-1-monophosphatase n=1 Tax=Thermoflavifilum aggregans TaxID=454188 RepID=A0A2M9CXS3_9BACT|nr:inositol monophosphatase family protein [Thermoflavifilum aggregans]PJJ76712.1 myo-inositol-1(or 4)-monophosphatase [Thermoflavifilum aggregans]
MYKAVLLDTIRAAGQVLLEGIGENFQISHKSSLNDLVTEVDKRSEAVILDKIRNQFPDHAILSEEAGASEHSGTFRWIIDPLDGTVNFAHRLPICSVSIALEKEGEVLMGAVYNPFLNELFFAEKGHGAYLNDKPIRVSAQDQIRQAFLVTGFPYQWRDMPHDPVQVFGYFIKQGVPVRRLGSAAIDLCWVACGRFDGYWEHHIHAWDVAAGGLIVREAGGQVTDFEGQPYQLSSSKLIASNGRIHEGLLHAVQTA